MSNQPTREVVGEPALERGRYLSGGGPPNPRCSGRGLFNFGNRGGVMKQATFRARHGPRADGHAAELFVMSSIVAGGYFV